MISQNVNRPYLSSRSFLFEKFKSECRGDSFSVLKIIYNFALLLN